MVRQFRMRTALRCRWFGSKPTPDTADLVPRSTVKRFTATGRERIAHKATTSCSVLDPCNEQTTHKPTKTIKGKCAIERHTAGPRMNAVNIQMLSSELHRQIFASDPSALAIDPIVKQELCHELTRHGIDISNPIILPDVDLRLPPLCGATIEEHFKRIAEDQSGPYRTAVNTIVDIVTPAPPLPQAWSQRAGWTWYKPMADSTTTVPTTVPFPPDEVLIFDVEVCVRAGMMPIIATALGSNGWYSWTSPLLTSQRPIVHTDSSYKNASQALQLDDLIPLESDPTADSCRTGASFKRPRVVIGHNVSYDRARVREQYWLEPTALRFLDTMSLHVCVSGITSYQRAMLRSSKASPTNDSGWREQCSLNNLADVYALYCGKRLNKSQRDTFVEGTLDEVRANFGNLMSYCAEDVRATKAVLVKLWPLFQERFPHPATLAGMLEMGSAYLPVNASWNRYLTESELTYDDLDTEAKQLLTQRADAACALLHNQAYKRDIWLWDQDWSVQELKLKAARKTKAKPTSDNEPPTTVGRRTGERKEAGQSPDCDAEAERLAKQFQHLYAIADRLPVRRPLLPGYPAWYRDLCSKPDTADWRPGPHQRISTGLQIAPKLLSLCWEGYPLHFIRGHGWGFLVPYRHLPNTEAQTTGKIPLEQLVAACPVVELRQTTATRNESDDVLRQLRRDVEQSISRKDYYRHSRQPASKAPPIAYGGAGVWCNLELEGCCFFLQLPHKDGAGHRVGNPLSKDFLAKFSENVLAGDGRAAERVVSIARMLSYWRNNRDRIRGQMVVWLNGNGSSGSDCGAILPQVVVCGTLTRRASEPTWMTASNAQRERIGSELRAMVQAPIGYRIVGADVDSQELWIASVLGDAGVASCGALHGGTPFGWMTLSGTKATRTDMHSVTAAAVGISRDHAKVINYARIYGAGQQFAERLLKQFNPTISQAEARSKATKMFSLTKGRRLYRLREQWIETHPDAPRHCTQYEALRLARLFNHAIDELFYPPQWCGGTESVMFNRLEEIASADRPSTPFLGGRLSRALEPEPTHSGDVDRFMPTRINWVVQSGAVDFLHLMLVCMRWLMEDRVRFCLSFHDEVRYLVAEQYAHKAALAMHVTNLLTRSFCAHRVGFKDLPQSVAFFSTVEVDRVLRKEAHADCRTPSNPHGLEGGYQVPNGESLDIYQTLAKLGPVDSDMSSWEWHKQPLSEQQPPARADNRSNSKTSVAT
ncbi:DNA polymerase subunit gamma-1, mitochondrial isoform X1 [Anopheles darlingi]|uniref:DNA polymerase subunit gamma-1, mitochondrial isoform X1 n=2 Tax=Anopheles darlingi TaxID=43151 RepID=UPI0021005F76|nr:DNA polymerase subunit gamma-1, mitochondrial isoform X1 [Anopheles darlingi]